MIRVFSGSCLSLDEVDHVREVHFVERPHLLGPGVDYFTEDGQPLRPQLCAHTLNKVFSGSALDLNDMGADDESNALAHADPSSPKFDPTISSILTSLQAEDPLKAQKSTSCVLVIGAGGYIGSYVVRSFLEAGYTVRAAVDDVNDTKLNTEIYALHPDAIRRLTIFGLDMLDPQSFRDHIRNVRYIVHCGVTPAFSRGEANIVKAHTEAVQALFNAIRTFGKSVKRVVVVGSGSAFAAAAPSNTNTVDESIIKLAGKGVAEAAPQAKIAFVNEAIRLSRMVHVELTVLLPTIMLGPSPVRETSEGMRTVFDLCHGSPFLPLAPRMHWNFVDVRDVADAAVKAAETETASNECFILSNVTLSMSQLGRLIREGHPHITAPIYDAPTALTMAIAPLLNAKISIRYLWKTLGVSRQFDNTKAKDVLGVTFTPISNTVSDSVTELIHHGYVPSSKGGKAVTNYSNEVATAGLGKVAVAVVVLGAIGAAAAAYLRAKNRK